MLIRFSNFYKNYLVSEFLNHLGSHTGSNERIIKAFVDSNRLSEKGLISLLKEEYGTGGRSHKGFSARYDKKGVTLSSGYKDGDHSFTYKWSEVVRLIDFEVNGAKR